MEIRLELELESEIYDSALAPLSFKFEGPNLQLCLISNSLSVD